MLCEIKKQHIKLSTDLSEAERESQAKSSDGPLRMQASLQLLGKVLPMKSKRCVEQPM